jgi:cephalosporin-C deacetylase-like acetyl esterase
MKKRCFGYCIILISFLLSTLAAKAQTDDVSITEHPLDSNAIFKKNGPVGYLIELKNGLKTSQQGKLSYTISDFEGRSIAQKSLQVIVGAKSSKKIKLDLPAPAAGFYKVNFIVNVTDYDDTVRRVFGVDTGNIHSAFAKPADFNSFWDDTKAELARVAPNFKMTEMPGLSKGNDQVYLVEMRSLDNLLVRAWLTLPKNRKPGQKLPVSLALPGYGDNLQPRYGSTAVAFLSLNVRGQGNSRDVIHPSRNEFINYNIEDKNKFIFRGMIMDCLRAVDFIASRPELDVSSIHASGGSMGGYLSLVVASLDPRIRIASADNPGYPDMRSLITTSKVFPINTIIDYARTHRIPMSKMMSVWDYFDLKNFVTELKCKAIVGIGLLDYFIPPSSELVMFNNIPGAKKLFVFPNLSHEVGPEIGLYTGAAVYKEFKVVERTDAFNKAYEAEQEKKQESAVDVILMKEQPENANAIYAARNPVNYKLNLQSRFSNRQEGTLTYIVSTPEDKVISKSSIPVSLNAKEIKTIPLTIPSPGSGFFKVKFAINVNDYDDTIRRVFGVDTASIRDTRLKPTDFDAFWTGSLKELAAVAPNFRMAEAPALNKGNDQVYKIEMKSLGNITIRGYLTLPKDRKINQKFPVSIYLPGYGAEAVPGYGTSAMAILSISVRGQNHSDDVIKPGREDFINFNIDNRNNYILRGAIMDCVRAVDFATSRAEIDAKAIYATGASMGGYLAIALSSLDKRVSLCAANNPTFMDFRDLVKVNDGFPMGSIKEYSRTHHVSMPNILDNLDYFDLKNFAPNVKCKTVIGIGLLDDIAPPTTQFVMYNNLRANKRIFVYPNLAHETGAEAIAYEGKWVYENLKVYDKWAVYNTAVDATDYKPRMGPNGQTIEIIALPTQKNGTFNDHNVISYNIDLKSDFSDPQEGKLEYIVKTPAGKLVAKSSTNVKIKSESTTHVIFEVPNQPPGFYNISFALNVTEYVDTLKRTFGSNVYDIHSENAKPADFDQFWDKAKEQLANVNPNFKMNRREDLEDDDDGLVYEYQMQSLGNVTIKGYITLPRKRRSNLRIPAYVVLQAYTNEVKPMDYANDIALVTMSIRKSTNPTSLNTGDNIVDKIEDKNNFFYRSALMDCVRLIDFLSNRPEIDSKNIYVTGSDVGGYLALALAGLDSRINCVAVNNPTFCDFRSFTYSNAVPMSTIQTYTKAKSLELSEVLNTLDYFDLKNFARRIKAKTLIGVGLLDPNSPPAGVLALYNDIPGNKKIFIYPNLGHQVGNDYEAYKSRWLYDNLGL